MRFGTPGRCLQEVIGVVSHLKGYPLDRGSINEPRLKMLHVVE